MKGEIIPTILVKTYQQFVRRLRLVEPYVKTVHLDVMDGQFVNSVTFGDAKRVGRLKHKLELAVHLMVNGPQNYVNEWASAGAVRFIFHREAVTSDKDVEKLIKDIKSAGMEAGVAINPETPVESISSFLKQLDFVLVMAVTPGWGGQIFQSKILEKVEQIKKIRPDLVVGVDGGVSLNTASQILKAGADILAAGTAIYKSKNISETIAQFHKLLAARR